MSFAQKDALRNLAIVASFVVIWGIAVWWKGWEYFAIKIISGYSAVWPPVYLSFLLLPQLYYKLGVKRIRKVYDERDYRLGMEANLSAFIVFWLYALTVCLGTVVLFQDNPGAVLPVYYIPIVVIAGTIVVSVAHSLAVFWL